MTRTLILLALVAAGCGTSDRCANDLALCQDAGPDAGQIPCTGQCALMPGNGWLNILLWSGPEGTTPPACPEIAQSYHDTGFLDALPSTVTCSPCTCTASANDCSLPSTITANSAACSASGTDVKHVPFSPPAGWDGACTAANPVSSATSVTVDPFVLTPGSCTPSAVGVLQFSGGKTAALSCTALQSDLNDVPGTCPSTDQVCAFPNLPGFTVCTLNGGDVACPDGWPTKHLFFASDHACECSCGAAVGESCSVNVTVYADDTCSSPLGSVTATSALPAACLDVAPGSALGSKSALVTYQPGTCPPALAPPYPFTVCCLP